MLKSYYDCNQSRATIIFFNYTYIEKQLIKIIFEHFIMFVQKYNYFKILIKNVAIIKTL